MIDKFNTKDTDKFLFSNYFKRAEECYHAAKTSFDAEEWNASAINSIHACISACDAMCVYFLGKRHAGERHSEAVGLFRTIKTGSADIVTNANRISRILSIKSMAEYEARLVFKPEAEKILKDCERFIEFVRINLPTQI